MSLDPATITPLVLAAGRGRRLGGNKALVAVGGLPALIRILKAAMAAGIGCPIVVIGHEGDHVRRMAETERPAPTLIENPDPDRGQTSSVQCGLEVLPENATAALVWPVDHPLVTVDDVAAIVAAARPETNVVLPNHGGRNGHPVLLHRRLFPAVLALAPDAPLRDLVRRERGGTVFVPRPTDSVLRDLDTPEDLAAAEVMLASGEGP